MQLSGQLRCNSRPLTQFFSSFSILFYLYTHQFREVPQFTFSSSPVVVENVLSTYEKKILKSIFYLFTLIYLILEFLASKNEKSKKIVGFGKEFAETYGLGGNFFFNSF